MTDTLANRPLQGEKSDRQADLSAKHSSRAASGVAPVELEDPRVIAAVQEYLTALECGDKLSRSEFLQRHPDLADVLAVCLAGLEFVHQAASGLHASAVQPPVAPAPADAEAIIGMPLGDFHILREVGRGGMGVVYEAEQLSLGRRVALKILPFAAALDPKHLQRFKNEAQAAALLQHAHIVPVYYVGCERGVHFYAMQYIEGQTLAAVIRELRQLAGLKSAGTKASNAALGSLADDLVTGRWLPVKQRGGEDSWPLPLAKQVEETCNRFEGAWKAAGATSDRPRIEDYLGGLAGWERSILVRELAVLDVYYRRLRGEDPQPADYGRRFPELGPDWVADAAASRAPAKSRQPTGLPPPDATPPRATLSTERSATSPAFFRTVAHLGGQAAEALDHAHQLGVIHRDIKPANLLVDAGGRLWVTDFGLAHCQSQPGLTMTGDLLGTLRYMSPEQALAKRVTVDVRTDVYSLGATLYELLTLEPAYNGRTREEVLQQIAFEEPRPPRCWNKAVPVELETIVLKALAKNPDERYATAQELADDLGRFLEDKPIRAKRPSLWQRAVKWARRHKTVVRAALVVLLLALMALTVASALIWRANQDLRQNLYYQHIALADREWSANNLGRMEQLLEACPVGLRGWEWRYLKRLRVGSPRPLHHAAAVYSAAFSPDGRWIVSGSQDGNITVWDATTGEKRYDFEAHEWHVYAVAFSPDGQLLASASWDFNVKVWGFHPSPAARALPLLHTLPHQDRVHSVAFSPDSRHLASAGEDKTVRVWDTGTGQEIGVLRGHTRLVWCVAYSPDGQSLASASDDETVKIWDAKTGQEKLTLSKHNAPVVSVRYSRDGRWLASTSGHYDAKPDGVIKIWDARTGQNVRTLHGHTAAVMDASFSPDGQRLASAAWDETVKLWDLQTGQEVLTLRDHRGQVQQVDFSPDGDRLVSASYDKTVRIWDARPVQEGETGQEPIPFKRSCAKRSLLS